MELRFSAGNKEGRILKTNSNKVLNRNEKKVIYIMVAAVFAALLLVGWRFYIDDYYKASVKGQKGILGNEMVSVEENDEYFYFTKKGNETGTQGLIFYPGAKVEEVAYSPLMLKLAEYGYQVYLVKMPYRLAIFGKNQADAIMKEHSNITEWTMMGHSLGGAMAASYSAKKGVHIDSLVLLAAYSTKSLKDKEIKVYSFYGSEDQILNQKKYKENLENLPQDYTEVVIDGGNHSNFGHYGTQKGDGTATISREEQIETVMDFMRN